MKTRWLLSLRRKDVKCPQQLSVLGFLPMLCGFAFGVSKTLD